MSTVQQDRNKATVRRLQDALSSGDPARLSATIDQIAEPDVLIRTPLPIETTGADALKEVFGRDFEPTFYRMLLFGAAMVIMMIWKPRGLVSTRMPSIFLKERKAVSGDLVKEGHG